MRNTSTWLVCLILFSAAVGARAGDAVRRLDLPEPAAVLPRSDLGEWVTRAQLVWDAGERNLVRKRLTVWRNFPGEQVDFLWLPDSEDVPRAGRIEGSGRLIWRISGASTADPEAIVAVYHGELVDGRPHGRGSYTHASGFAYEGDWRDGLMHGEGRFVTPLGSEILGTFERGRPDVDSRIFDPYKTLLDAGHGPSGFTVAPADGSPTVRLAQYTDHGDVRIGVFVAPRLPSESWENRIAYKGGGKSVLVVEPEDSELMAAWLGTGDNVGGATYSLDGLSSKVPVELRLTVENNSTRRIRISGGSLVVTESVPALNPLVTTYYTDWPGLCEPSRAEDKSGHLDLSVSLLDVGWAKIDRSTFSVQLGSQPNASRPKGEVRIGALDGSGFSEIGAALSAAGAPKALCDALLSCDAKTLDLVGKDAWDVPAGFDATPIERCLEGLKRNGKLGAAAPYLDLSNVRNVTLEIVGRYEYEWIDHENQRQRSSRLFPAKIFLADLVTDYAGAEGSEPEPFPGNDLALRTQGKGYEVQVPLSASVDAGKEGSWSVNVSAPKSSIHSFVFRLNVGADRLDTRPVKLTYLRPNVGAPDEERTAFKELRWIQFASSRSAEAAQKKACSLVEKLEEVQVLRAMNGWYAVVAGPYPKEVAEKTFAQLKQQGLPDDSIVTGGERWISSPSPWGVRSYDCD